MSVTFKCQTAVAVFQKIKGSMKVCEELVAPGLVFQPDICVHGVFP